MSTSSDKNSRDNRANQLNREHPAFHRARGASPERAEQAAERARESNSPEQADPKKQV